MAIIGISLSSVCTGGNHVNISVNFDGNSQVIQYTADDIIAVSPSELIHDFVLGVLRLHCKGMTRAQARSAIQTGFTVTI